METPINGPDDLELSIKEDAKLGNELAFLFGRETVELARHIDIADLQLNEKMTDSIAAGIRRLKESRNDPDAQVKLIEGMDQGSRLLLCMWIMDMDLLDKIRNGSYIKTR